MTVAFRPADDLDDDDDRDLVITFSVTRGVFDVPAHVLEAADAGDDYPLRRLFAINLPDRVEHDVLESTRRVHKDGSAHITWRHIVTHVAPA